MSPRRADFSEKINEAACLCPDSGRPVIFARNGTCRRAKAASNHLRNEVSALPSHHAKGNRVIVKTSCMKPAWWPEIVNHRSITSAGLWIA